MKKRFLAMLLCLSVLLMACACAAETMEPPAVSETESQAPAPQFTLSEVNAESSKTEEPAPSAEPSGEIPPIETSDESLAMEESDIELEPIQPIEPIKPEEKETTLELLREFPIGKGGIPIDMSYEWDATNAILEYPMDYFADENGAVYYFWYNWYVNLETGRVTKLNDWMRSHLVYGGYLYGITLSGELQKYSADGQLISSVQIGDTDKSIWQTLHVLEDGTVVVKKQGKLYNEKGAVVSDVPVNFVKEDDDTNGILTINGRPLLVDVFGSLLSGGIEKLTARRTEYRSLDNGYFEEELYTQFSQSGELLSRFKKIAVSTGERKGCSIKDSSGQECKYYTATTVVIGKTVFEDVLEHFLFQGADNELYLLLLYPDRAELYKINPGYSDIGLRNLDEMTLEDLMAPMEGFSVGASLLSGGADPIVASETTTVNHVPLAVETVKRRANFLVYLQWKLTKEHVTIRNGYEQYIDFPEYYDSYLPQVENPPFEAFLEGVPYCVGGMNGYETFDLEDDNYIARSFLGSLTRIVNQELPCTIGNVKKEFPTPENYSIVTYTAGLDCSGFVGSTCGVPTKLGTYSFDEYGHPIDSIEDLEPYDILVEVGVHCYFYLDHDVLVESNNPDKKKYALTVQDCTTAESTGQRTTERTFTITETKFASLEYYRPYYTFERTATHHRYYCTHPDCAGTSNAEASAWIPHEWEVPDASKPCERYCKVCNYEDTSLHAFTYLADSATSHTRTCTVCGYSETEAHGGPCTAVSATQHVKLCMACGYSVTENHGGPCIAISATQHVTPCMACGYSVTSDHTFTYTYTSGGHTATCTGCGYSVSAMHSLAAAGYNLLQHTRVCSCGYSVPEAHTLHYHYDADGHWQECSVCSFETASLAHNFANSECTVCGCPEFIIMDIIAIPEEDEPLPVPEDQKATL
jgi:hypothetical protein